MQYDYYKLEYSISIFTLLYTTHISIQLLQHYKENSTETNHEIVKMLHRLIDNSHCNVAPLLYQVSLFDLFMRICTDQAISADKNYNELRNFIKKGVFKRMS